MTREEAIAFGEAGRWEPLSHRERAELQMAEEFMCMPFDVFHEAITKTLGRDVYTHEFALNSDGLRRELRGERPAPTPREVLESIPADKRIVTVAPPPEADPCA